MRLLPRRFQRRTLLSSASSSSSRTIGSRATISYVNPALLSTHLVGSFQRIGSSGRLTSDGRSHDHVEGDKEIGTSHARYIHYTSCPAIPPSSALLPGRQRPQAMFSRLFSSSPRPNNKVIPDYYPPMPINAPLSPKIGAISESLCSLRSISLQL
jgi:hypothetical protein